MTSTGDHPSLTVLFHRYEQKYRSGDLRGLSAAGATLVVAGTDVLVIAPHSVAHKRAGLEKAAEFYTGAIAELCAEVAGWSAVTALRQYDDSEGGNSFGQMVGLMLALVEPRIIIELHGMGSRWETDVAIGRAARSSSARIANDLQAALAPTFITCIDHPFTGESSVGARATLADPRVRYLHLELGPRLRMDTTSEDDLHRLIQGLKGIADDRPLTRLSREATGSEGRNR